MIHFTSRLQALFKVPTVLADNAKKVVNEYNEDRTKKEFMEYLTSVLDRRKKEMEELMTAVKAKDNK